MYIVYIRVSIVCLGEITLRCCIDSPPGVSMYSARRVPGWPSTYPFPHGETLDLFNCFHFDRFFFRLLRFCTIAHTLVRIVSPALCRFARSDTPWPQGSRTYSAQKNFTRPGHTDRPILLHFPLISLRDSRQEHS